MPKGTWSNSGLWTQHLTDYLGRAVDVQVAYAFPSTDIVAPGLTGFRDPDCALTHIWVGKGGGLRVVPIPAGDFNLTAGQLNAFGFNTIEELTQASITIGMGT